MLFLETFDPVQMRYAGAEWKKLVDLVEQIARAVGSVRLDSTRLIVDEADMHSPALLLHPCDQP